MSSQAFEGEDPGFEESAFAPSDPEPESLSDEDFYGAPAPVFGGKPRWERPNVDPALDLLRGGEAAAPAFDGDLERELTRAVGLGTDPGLGLLVDLARRGEYDPWNVDIVSVTDRYLEAMDESLDARDLQRVARLIFYAAALIHLKAQAMAAREKELDYEEAVEQTLLEEFGDEYPGAEAGYPRLHPDDQPLEYGFLRGSEGFDAGGLLSPREKPLRARGLTLLDLIQALREYDDRLAERELEDEEEPEFDGEIAFEECVGSSHQDDLGQDMHDLRQALWTVLAERERIGLSRLSDEGRGKAATYLALLFLANDEEVHLEQEEFYGEVLVVPGPYFGEVRAGVPVDDEPHGEEAE